MLILAQMGRRGGTPDVGGAFWRGRGFCPPVFARVTFLACCALSWYERMSGNDTESAWQLEAQSVGVERPISRPLACTVAVCSS
jgi:hypothetical protein